MNYVKPLAEIDANLEAHRRFLDEGYAAGYLLASGPRGQEPGNHPRPCTGRRGIAGFSKQRPINKAGVAQYEILEFTPVKSDPRLKDVLK